MTITIPNPGTPDSEILGSWRLALVEATAIHLETGPAPWKSGINGLRRNEFHQAEVTNADAWAFALKGRDSRPRFNTCVLPEPRLKACWEWLWRWWLEDYLPRHPDIALREAMSDVASAQEFSSWMYDTEIVAWRLMRGEIDAATGPWHNREMLAHLPQLAAVLRRLHDVTGGWWTVPDGALAIYEEAVFVSADEWTAIRTGKWRAS